MSVTFVSRLFSQLVILAEIGQAHDGSLAMAKSLITQAAESGAHGIKFQFHLPEHESTLDEPFRVSLAGQDTSRFEYWARTSFSEEQWSDLVQLARQAGLGVVASVFSEKAVELATKLEIDAIKLGSAEVLQPWLVESATRSGIPLIYSSGMSSWSEIDDLVAQSINAGAKFALLQCTSKYPTSLQDVGLNVMQDMMSRYSCPIGFSDHSGSLPTSIAAIALGAKIVEVHVTFDRRILGPDSDSSLVFSELGNLREFADAFDVLHKEPVDKNLISEEIRTIRHIFGRSLSPVRDISAGKTVAKSDFLPKKPGGGIPAGDVDRLAGKVAKHDLPANRIVVWEDFNG